MLRASSIVAILITAAPIHAADLNTNLLDLELSGGVSAAAFHLQHRRGSDQNRVQLTDFMVELVSAEPQARQVGVTLGVGKMISRTVLGESLSEPIDSPAGLQFGWVSIAPLAALSLDVGKLATNIGYEVRPSYANTAITLSGLWSAQPNFYPGIRANYTLKENTVYVEAENYVRGKATRAWGAGWRGATGDVDYGFNYFNASGDRRIYDFVLTLPLGDIVAGFNVDYVRIERTFQLQDNHGLGIGFYASGQVGGVELPVRIESLRDGNSGVYGLDYGWTVTVTPTINLGQAGFARAELAYVYASEERKNPLTGERDSLTNWVAAVQIGTRF